MTASGVSVAELLKAILRSTDDMDGSTAQFLAAQTSQQHIPLNGAALLRAALAGGPGTINDADVMTGRCE